MLRATERKTASESGAGTVELSTDAETVTGTATDKATTPANITAKMSAPGPVGDTTPADATFTTARADAFANVQVGTTYAPVLSDAGKLITMSNAGAITFTIPANAAVAFRVGTVINLLQLGAGQVTVAITADTLSSSGAMVALTGQYSAATLVKTAATVWVLFGDLA